MRRVLGVVFALLLTQEAPAGTPPLVDVHTVVPKAQIDMPYAGTNNVAETRLYPVARCLLRAEVAKMLALSQAYLDTHKPGTYLLLKDCYRPLSAQQKLFAAVLGTRRQHYVANPNRRHGSVHTYGAAVDVTLAELKHGELDMGTPFDFLGPLAEPRREAEYLRSQQLTREQVARRHLLRDAMVKGGGFLPISNEWWHFDAWRGARLRARYDVLDLPLDSPLVPAP